MAPFSLSRLWRISRPRFWIYLLGPYALGLAAAGLAQQPLSSFPWRLWWFLAFFSFPANFLTYGINDIFDYETDKHNPKKVGYETLVTPAEHPGLWRRISLFSLPFFLGLFGAPLSFQICFAVFLFLSVTYSAPPIRAKARPLLDSLWNVLYVFPGLCAYFLLKPDAPFPWAILFAAWLWCLAMHAYSATLDIWADRSAKVETIATYLGRQSTLWLCLACYVLSGILASSAGLGTVGLALGFAYVLLLVFSLLTQSREALFSWYRAFPLLNTLCGGLLFCWLWSR